MIRQEPTAEITPPRVAKAEGKSKIPPHEQSHLWPKAEDRTRAAAANHMEATAVSADSVRTPAGS